MKQIEQTISSIEVAEMLGKTHGNLVRDVRRYLEQFNEIKIDSVNFFKESTYTDSKGEKRICYQMTKKGCEFIAHKLTGTKGTEFTARYINRFHEMENVIRDGIPEKKKEKLSSVNQMAKNISGLLGKAGVDAKFIAAEVVRIYTDNGYPVHSPIITEDNKLWDCTSIAKELGIMSTSGKPHDKAVAAIIQKLDSFTDEIVRTAYSRNGHDGITVQYKESVFAKVREWLEENRYPTVIEYRLANGNINNCKVIYNF